MEKSCTIQDVFERFYPSYEKRNSPPAHHRKTAYHIMNCKTGAFGVNISVCEDCGCISIHNNSCRSRCCPMCQEFPKEKWIDAQKENVLDAPYYHVVFTVPEELNSIIYSNQKLLYDALYHAASATLNELSKDAKYLGADIGYICILHTWGSAMNYHVVFTVPEELNPIIYSNQKLLYDALYHAASSTLDELAKDSKYLGADIHRIYLYSSYMGFCNELSSSYPYNCSWWRT